MSHFLEERTMVLVPEEGPEMEHAAALFLIADGWKILEYNYSQTVTQTIGSTCYHTLSQGENVDVLQTLVDGMKQANHKVHQMDKQFFTRNPDLYGDLFFFEGPRATAIAVAISGQTISLAHAGWCRAYLLHGDQVRQLTDDHTAAASLVRAGMLTPQEAKTDPRRNLIYRVLGTSPDIDVETVVVPFQDGDILALCTRHLIEHVEEEELVRMLKPQKLQASVEKVTQKARRRFEKAERYGAHRNLTLLAVKLSLPARKR